MDLELLAVMVFWEIISLCLLINLWSGKGNTINKILSSLVLIIPFLGPIIFVCVIEPPVGSYYEQNNG